MFSKGSTHDPKDYMPEDEEIGEFGDTPDVGRGATHRTQVGRGAPHLTTQDDTEPTAENVAAPNGANDGRAAPDTEAEETPAERTEDVGTTLQETELHPYKWLKQPSSKFVVCSSRLLQIC